jgi:tripartite-type tricarboxylate transporter receptor subunit TctC
MRILHTIGTLALALAATSALAQPFPSKPVRVIVPFGPGTTSDIIARMLSDRMTQSIGQSFVVENRPGAGGTIGTELVAKSPADGYTLLLSTAATPISASVYRDLRYDTAKAFSSVTLISTSPLGFAANLNFPPKTFGEFLEYARKNPGRVSFGSLGIGTSHHLTGEKLKLDAGIEMVHVPYRGSGPAHADLMAGQIQVMFDNIVALMPHFKSGKLRPLGVSSAKRHPLLPDVPSISEGGVKDFETVAWFGMLAPAGTPRDVIARLNAEAVKALQIPEVRQRLIDGGSEVVGNSPEAADKFLQDEIRRWAVVVRAANVKPD